MNDTIRKIFDKHGVRTFSFSGKGDARTFRAHLNDVRFCPWGAVERDLKLAGFVIDDDYDGDANQLRVKAIPGREPQLLPGYLYWAEHFAERAEANQTNPIWFKRCDTLMWRSIFLHVEKEQEECSTPTTSAPKA